MKKFKKIFALLLAGMMSVTTATADDLVAFPGAAGWGRFAKGARATSSATVYHVTNLNDSGTGSLRDAVSQPNRIVVFDVAGVIRINSRLIFSSNLYVAGQTAPGEGVTVYGDGTSFSGADNIIVRYMRFRMGTVGTNDKDAAGIANGQNMIFDHCSFSWGQDENFSINWDNKGTAPQNITLMNSIVGQGLMTHSAGGLMQADKITLYRILLVDNSTRNFKVKGTNQYVNNLVYNWKNYAYNMGGDSEGTSYVNIEGNLFINGPAVGGDALTGGNSDFHFYGNDNWQDKNRNGVFDPSEFTGTGGGDKVSTPYDYPELEKWAGKSLIDNLLPDVGASLPYRDIADCYMIDEVKSFGTKGALIARETELPIGAPDTWNMYKGTKKQDTDGDGMPDAWEEANGTNPSVADATVVAANGYLNIENYINGITKDDREFFLRAPMSLTLESSTPNSLTISWADYSDNEDAFIVEYKKAGDTEFTALPKLDANTTSCIIAEEGMTPATSYVVRVCAVNGENKSDYTAEVIMKTRPEQTDLVNTETFDGTGVGEWLIDDATDKTYTLDEAKEYTAVVVRTGANITLNGTGYVSGTASMNKTGKGTFTVATPQQYTGATVLHDGVYEFSSIANGDVASGLGMSQEFAQNWVMAGGTYKYTGATTATNRSAKLYDDTELNIAKSGTIVTMNGGIEGNGTLTVNGEGQILVNNANFFLYDGNLVVKGGEVRLASKEVSDAGIGSASKLILQGGKFSNVGKNETYTTFNFPIEATAGTTSTVDFDLWNNNKCNVSGLGTLIWNVHYIREYIEGNWDNYNGHIIVNGTGSGTNSSFFLRNDVGIKNATIELNGNARVNGRAGGTFYLGGLSGAEGTALSGFDVKNAGSGTWIVGGANTDEDFHGAIDDYNQTHNSKMGKASIVKEGLGDWRLTGANTYAGATTVNAGRLIVNGTHSGTGAVTVKSGATLAGKGTLAGKVTLYSGATLQVGDTLATDKGLTLSGGLTIQSNVKLVLNEAMQEATHYNNDKIQVFIGTATGTFAEIIPATPGEGQTWDTSALYTNGILKVVGGDEKPQEPEEPKDPEPESETQKVCIAWGNCTRTGGDSSCTQLVGNEASPSNNIGYSMKYTTVTDKYYSKGEKMTYDFDGIQRTGIKLSNGAQNTIVIPEGHKVTKITFWSVVGTNSSNRTSYWKEVAGQTYTEADGQIFDLTKTASAPNKAEFVLDNVQNELTFTNTGEQQSVVIVLEYHTGGADGVENVTADVESKSDAIYNLAGQKVDSNYRGIVIKNGKKYLH